MDLQEKIIAYLKSHPNKTHDDVVKNLPSNAEPQRIRMNMVALARRGILDFHRNGWDGNSYTKRYFLVG